MIITERASRALLPVLLLLLVAAPYAVAQMTRSIDCGAWTSGTAVRVVVGSGEEVVLSGCVAEGVNVTLQCGPGASVLLEGWAAPAVGWIAVTGLIPWVVEEVWVSVVDSVVVATAGPVVAIEALANAAATVVVRKIALRVVNSTLQSAPGGAVVGVTVAGSGGADGQLTSALVEDVTLIAANATLLADGGGGSALAVALGVALHVEGPAWWAVAVRNVSMTLSGVTAAALGVANGSSVAGVVATGGGLGQLTVRGLWACVSESNLSAAAGVATAVSGVAATGNATLVLAVDGVAWSVQDSMLMAEVNGSTATSAVAAVGGVGVGAAAQVSVSGTAFVSVSTTVLVSVSGNASVGAAGAVAMASTVANVGTSTQLVDAVTVLRNGSVTVRALGGIGSVVVAVVGGIASGFVGAQQQHSNVTVWVENTTIRIDCANANNNSMSGVTTAVAVAGAAVGLAQGLRGSQLQEGATVWIGYSSVSVSSNSSNENIFGYQSGVFASAVAGLAVGPTYSQQQSNVTVWIGYSNISINSNTIGYVGAVLTSAVAGIVTGSNQYSAFVSSLHQLQQNTVVWIGYSNVSSSSNNQAALINPSCWSCGQGISAFALAGIASGFSNNPQEQANVTVWIGYSFVSSDSIGSGYGVAFSSAVGSITAGTGYFVDQRQTSTVTWIWYSNISIAGGTNGGGMYPHAGFAVAGIAFGAAGYGASQLQQDTTVWIGYATVVIGGASDYPDAMFAWATAGVAAGITVGPQQQMNATVWIGYTTVASTVITGILGDAASAVAGVTAAQTTSSQQQSNFTVWIGYSNISSTCISTGYVNGPGEGASVVTGLAAGWISGPLQQQTNVTAWIGYSNVSSNSNSITSSNCGYAGSSGSAVAGVAAGEAYCTQQQEGAFVWIGYSNVSSVAGDSSCAMLSASAVVGVVAGLISGLQQQQTNATAWIGYSNVSSNSSDSAYLPYSASGVIGVAAGEASGTAQQQEGMVVWIGYSMLSVSSGGRDAYAAAAGVGVAAAWTDDAQQQLGLMAWIGYSSLAVSSGADYSNATYTAAAAIGVAAGWTNGTAQQLGATDAWVGYSNVSSISAGSNWNPAYSTYSAAAVAGIAAGVNSTAPQQLGAAVHLWTACTSFVNVSTPVSVNFAALSAVPGCPLNVTDSGGCCSVSDVLLTLPAPFTSAGWAASASLGAVGPTVAVGSFPDFSMWAAEACPNQLFSATLPLSLTATQTLTATPTLPASGTGSPSASRTLTPTLGSPSASATMLQEPLTLNASWVGDLPLRRGAVVELAILLRGTPGSGPVMLSVSLGAQGLLVPQTAALPAGCVWESDVNVTCAVWLSAAASGAVGSATVVIPAVLGLNATDWGDAGAGNASAWIAAPGGPQNATLALMGLATVLSGGRTVAADMAVNATQPAMNMLGNGTVLTVYGKSLDLLPAVLPIGPVLCSTSVVGNASVATAVVAWPEQLDVAALGVNVSSVVAGLLAAYAGQPWAEYFVSTSLTESSAAAIALVVNAIPGASELEAFNVRFGSAEVFVNEPPVVGPAAALDATGTRLVVDAVYPGVQLTAGIDASVTVGAVSSALLGQLVLGPTVYSGGLAGAKAAGTGVALQFDAAFVRGTTWRDVAPVVVGNDTVYSGTVSATLDVELVDSVSFTVTRWAVSYSVAEFVVMGRSLGPYVMQLVIAPNSSVLNALSLLAYSAMGVAGLPYPITSDTAGCGYDATNISVVCAATSSAGNATWVVELYATPPSYYSGVVVGVVQVMAAQSPGVQFYVQLTSDGREPLLALTMPAGWAGTVSSQSALAAEAVAWVNALHNPATCDWLGGVIGTTVGACAFWLLVVAIAQLGFGRTVSCDGGTAGVLRTAARHHVWVGAVLQRTPQHVTLLATHTLVLLGVTSALLERYNFAASDSAEVVVPLILLLSAQAATAAVVLHAVVAAPFARLNLRGSVVQGDCVTDAYPVSAHDGSRDADRASTTVGCLRSIDDGHRGGSATVGKPAFSFSRTSLPQRRWRILGYALCATMCAGSCALAIVVSPSWCSSGSGARAFAYIVCAAVCLDVALLQPAYSGLLTLLLARH